MALVVTMKSVDGVVGLLGFGLGILKYDDVLGYFLDFSMVTLYLVF